MITLSWEIISECQYKFRIVGIGVNREHSMYNMPEFQSSILTNNDDASNQLVEWIVSSIRNHPGEKFQIVPNNSTPLLTRETIIKLRKKNVDVPFVNRRNLYEALNVSRNEIISSIRKMHDSNERIDNVRWSFYSALEILILQQMAGVTEFQGFKKS